MSAGNPPIKGLLLIGESIDPAALETTLADGSASPVVIARSGAWEGRSALRERDEPIDCILLERVALDHEWAEAVNWLREFDPDIPIVLCVDSIDAETTRAARNGAVADCVAVASASPDYESVAQAVLNAVCGGQEKRSTVASVLDTLFSRLPVFIYAKDEDARFVRCPEEYWIGRTFEGKRADELWAWEYGEELYEDDRRVLETGIPIINKRFDDASHPFDPTYNYVSTTKIPRRNDDGEITGIVGVTQDISELKEYEQQLRRHNERLEEFAGVVAHDLRNPLAVATGLLEHALDTDDPAVLDDLEEPLDRMEALIDDLLALARLGQTVSEPKRISLTGTAHGAWESVENDTARLVSDLDDENDEIDADPSRLRQLFENLFRNAVEHGSTSPRSHAREDAVEHGGSDVTVEVGTLEDGFYVADDGPGIPDDEREQVFEHGHTTSTDGTGLGLSIVQNVVGAHGWEIAAEESAAGGAQFSITGVDRYSGIEVETEDDASIGADSFEAETAYGPTGGSGMFDVRDQGDGFEVTASGFNIWQLENEFHYIYQRVEGDVDFRARVASLEPAHIHSKVGVMVRESLGERSRHLTTSQTAEKGPEICFARHPEDRTKSVQLFHPAKDERAIVPRFDPKWREPCWVRITREGDVVTGYASPDGEEWTPIGRQEIPMGEEVYVGLSTCSAHVDDFCTARFDSVFGLEQWDNCDVGDVNIEGDARQIRHREYVLSGSGEGLCGPDRGGYHASTTLDGDGAVAARVLDFEDDAPASAEAGVVLRTPDGSHAVVAALSPAGDAIVGWETGDKHYRRTIEDDLIVGTVAPDGSHIDREIERSLPAFVRIERNGDRVRIAHSRMGRRWDDLGSTTVPADRPVEIGLAVASGDPGETTSATFDLVEIEDRE